MEKKDIYNQESEKLGKVNIFVWLFLLNYWLNLFKCKAFIEVDYIALTHEKLVNNKK